MEKVVDREKIEEAKKELNEYREGINYILEKQEDAKELRELLEKTTTRLSPTKTSRGSMTTDKFSDGVDRIVAIEKDTREKLSELLTKRWVVENKIDKLEGRHRDVLFLRYIRCKSWRDITCILGFDSDNAVFKLHGKALAMYAEL